VGNDEVLNCYDAHSEDNSHFRRRCYWMLNPAMDHIVLGKHSAGPISVFTLGSFNIIQSSNNYATQLASSAGASEFDETYNNTPGPSFLDGSPGVLTNSNGASRSSLTERIDKIDSSPELQIDEALKRIQKQLSLEHVKENGTFYNENEYLDDLGFTYNEQNYSGFEEFQYGSDNSVSLQYSVELDIAQDQINTSRNGATHFERLHQYQQTLKDDSTVSSQQNYIWKDMLTYDGDAAYDGSLQNYMKCFYLNNKEIQWKHHSGDTGTSNDYHVNVTLQTVEIRVAKRVEWNGTSLASESSLTIAQEQKFTIREISPEWVYVIEPSKRNDTSHDHDYYKHEAEYRRDIEADRDSNCIELYYYLKGVRRHTATGYSDFIVKLVKKMDSKRHFGFNIELLHNPSTDNLIGLWLRPEDALVPGAYNSHLDHSHFAAYGYCKTGFIHFLTIEALLLDERIDEIDSSPELQIDEALKRIQKQLSLEHVKENGTFYNENEYPSR
ncbi:ankyrin repeat-containing protein, partial [Tanacetum coccineum]